VPAFLEIDAFIARWSRWRVALIAAGSAGFVLNGLWMTGFFGPTQPDRGDPAYYLVVGWVSIVFFGACLLFAVKKLVTGGVACRIDAQGILEPRISPDPIPWQMISHARVVSIRSSGMFNRGQRMIGFDIAPDYAQRFSAIRRSLIAFNENTFGFSAALSPVGTDRSLADFVDAIRFRAPAIFEDQFQIGG
jgi:hypothetical protein